MENMYREKIGRLIKKNLAEIIARKSLLNRVDVFEQNDVEVEKCAVIVNVLLYQNSMLMDILEECDTGE